MDELSFYRQLGLVSNPFQYTNADEEDELQNYFIPPPYFESVWGDPSRPSSCVVFAPRGGGKSAQRRMIELRSLDSRVLAVQYSRFEFEKGKGLEAIDLDYHLRNINRICLIALLMLIYEKNITNSVYSGTERMHIQELCRFYLFDLNSDRIIGAVNSIMTIFDKGKEFFKRNLWAINTIIDSIFKKVGLSPAGQNSPSSQKFSVPSKNHLDIILSLIKKLGIESTYILVDKVDETQLTGNDAKASFDLVATLIRDLDLLQMKNIGFKFFLWDALYPFYEKMARPDRVSQFRLDWAFDDLDKMIKLRLRAYSLADRVVGFSDLLDSELPIELTQAVEGLVIAFSHGSPRDVVRICRQMGIEQQRISPDSRRIGLEAVTSAFNVFCEQRAKEVVSEQVLSELRKAKRLDFTVSYIASEVFKISTNGARNKIGTWLNSGVVRQVDDILIKGSKKPVHHYAVVDSRVAKAMFPELTFDDFLGKKVRNCQKCKTWVYRDWDLSSNHICQICKVRITSSVE